MPRITKPDDSARRAAQWVYAVYVSQDVHRGVIVGQVLAPTVKVHRSSDNQPEHLPLFDCRSLQSYEPERTSNLEAISPPTNHSPAPAGMVYMVRMEA